MNEYGLCECGCGRKTTIANKTDRQKKWTKGKPIRFINGHSNVNRTTLFCVIRNKNGYIETCFPEHPNARRGGYIKVHRLVVENILGHLLPFGASVHHVNGIRDDNRPSNLVVCQSEAYHRLLHQRARALSACGNANWLKCRYCKQYGDPSNMYVFSTEIRRYGYHRKCENKYWRQLYYKRKQQFVIYP